ncbi:hypothetical protein NMY22_g8151 [Coprinellus aureogranulatus]|nr:hypothetical protein NMY22_g8151 [Coprinellus aureogranulatus]
MPPSSPLLSPSASCDSVSRVSPQYPIAFLVLQNARVNSTLANVVEGAPNLFPSRLRTHSRLRYPAVELALRDLAVVQLLQLELGPVVITLVGELKATAFIFACGKTTAVTGAKSEDDSRLTSCKYTRITQRLDFDTKIARLMIQGPCSPRLRRLSRLKPFQSTLVAFGVRFTPADTLLHHSQVQEEIFTAFNTVCTALCAF